MAIRFGCACGARLTAKDELAGRLCGCPHCGATVRIEGTPLPPPVRRPVWPVAAAAAGGLVVVVAALLVFGGGAPAPAPAPAKGDPFSGPLPPRPPPAPPALMYETEDADAAVFYRARMIKLPQLSPDVETLATADPAQVKAWLQRAEPLLREAARASRARRCEWTYKELTFGTELPHVAPAIKTAKALSARIRIRAEEGKVEEALDDVLVACRIGSDYLLDRMLITHLVGVVVIGVATEAFRSSLAVRDLDPALLRRFEAHLKRLADRWPPFERSMECERDMMTASVDMMIAEGLTRMARQFNPGDTTVLDELLKGDRALVRAVIGKRLSEHWDLLLRDAREPLHSSVRHTDLEKIKAEAAKELEALKAAKPIDRDRGLRLMADVFFQLLAPAADRAKPTLAIGRMSIEGMRTWCLLELHRGARGAYPRALSEVASPADAFDGGTLKYVDASKPGRAAFVLTSAGPKGDWRERAALVADACQFDIKRVTAAAQPLDPAFNCTFWAVRPR